MKRLKAWFHHRFRADHYWETDLIALTETTYTRFPGADEYVKTHVREVTDVRRYADPSSPLPCSWTVKGGALRD